MASKRFLSLINVTQLDSDPASGSSGDVYYNFVSDKLRVYDGTTWSDIGGASSVQYIIYADDPPSSPFTGQIWVESDSVLDGGLSPLGDIDGGTPSSTYTSFLYLGTPTSTFNVIYDGGIP